MSGVASVREVLARERAGGSVTVRGWLRTTRHSKGLSFLELSDGSCFAGLQVVAEPSLPNYESEVSGLGTGCAVSITGEVVDSPGQGQRYELRATWLGGTRILDRLDRVGYDVFTSRPKLGASDALVIACETLLWREIRLFPTRS